MSRPTCGGQRQRPRSSETPGLPARSSRLLSVAFRWAFTDRTPTGAATPPMGAEHGPVSRLGDLAPGTHVQLAPGRVATLLEVTFTRAIVELDRGEDRRREITPG